VASASNGILLEGKSFEQKAFNLHLKIFGGLKFVGRMEKCEGERHEMDFCSIFGICRWELELCFAFCLLMTSF
jgi:hypothetical protein